MERQPEGVAVTYFVLCDQVITEVNTQKQSLIGIYTALMAEQLPFYINVAVAVCVRVETPEERSFNIRIVDPDGKTLFSSPKLPCDWSSVRHSLQLSSFGTMQIAVQLQAMPVARMGVHTAELMCDGVRIAAYPVAVLSPQKATRQSAQIRFPPRSGRG